MSMESWNKAKGNLHEVERFLSMLGKEQRTTADARGKVHSVVAATTIQYQEVDGSKNYHECKAFDFAMSKAVRNNFASLKEEAIKMLRADVEHLGITARRDVEKLLAQMCKNRVMWGK